MADDNTLWSWAETDVGRKRKHNEDYYMIDSSVGLFALADGMGGYEAGEVASRMVLERLQQQLHMRKDLFSAEAHQSSGAEDHRQKVRAYLEKSVQKISDEILNLAKSHGADVRMGTTLCGLVALGGSVAAVVHVGDSRCYLLREQQLYQLTEDHSLVAEQVKMGILTPQEAENSRHKNVITRAVGLLDRLQVDVFFIDLLPGDRFLVCSDGLHGYLQGNELARFLATPEPDEYEHIPAQLIDVANRRGGKDNITVVLLAVEGPEQKEGEQKDTEINRGVDVLRSNPLFRGMTYPEMLKILPSTSVREFQPGTTLLFEGDNPEYLYIVQEGNLAVYRRDEQIAQLGPGDYVGEMAVFSDEPSSATVVAQTPAQCLTISCNDLLAILKKSPEIGFKVQSSLIKVLCRRLRDTTNELAWTRREWRQSMAVKK